MPGFFIEIGKKQKIDFVQDDKLINQVIEHSNFYVERRTINKFLEDKIFFDNEQYFCVLDGIVLNKHDFLKEKSSTWEEVFIELYEKNGDTFYNKFRGSFCGAIYDKLQNKWIIFTDHIGSRHIYFSKINANVIITTDIKSIYDYYKVNDFKYELDIDAAYLLLSYGFMLEDYTLSKDIKKLLPGHYLTCNNKKITLKQYYKLDNTPDDTKTEDEFIELMDHYFKQAIKRQFEKDKEYGYKHFVALSGGLDSRMTCWVAHEMGYKNQVNFTFSQSDYLDETIAKEISRDLKHDWIFKALDGGNLLYDYDEVTAITGGNVLYYTVAHTNSMLKLINFDSLGINHSGQLGDVVFGTFYKSLDASASWNIGDGAHSQTLAKKTKAIPLKINYANQEIFNFYNRGFSGANNGLLITQQYTETMSPFYDVDLLNFALSIPLKYRFDHYIYKKWITQKYPQSTNYVWEKSKSKITDFEIRYRERKYPLNQLFWLIAHKLTKHKFDGHNSKQNMNPLGYWYQTNTSLKKNLDSFFNTNIHFVQDLELKDDLENLYMNDSTIEKIQVISLLSAIEKFYK